MRQPCWLRAMAGLNSNGFISVNDLMAAAAAEVLVHPQTKNGSLDRLYQEAMKRVLDDANSITRTSFRPRRECSPSRRE